MAITISADDPRTIRAIEIAANASHWRVVRDPEGRERFRVPSQTRPDRVYLVTENSCTCEDFLRGSETDDAYACKHVLAVRLYRELVRAQQREPARRGQLRLVR